MGSSMSIKFNFTKAGIIALTTTVAGALGTLFHGTEYGILAGLIVGIALEFEQVAITDITGAQGASSQSA
jgi:thiamine transporter ThiT